MRIPLAAIALAIAVAAPNQPAHAQTYGKDQTTTTTKKKTVKTKADRHGVRSGSPHSTNPEYDVYVNGVYVGSDPDWRIRESLKREYCSESIDGCGY